MFVSIVIGIFHFRKMAETGDPADQPSVERSCSNFIATISAEQPVDLGGLQTAIQALTQSVAEIRDQMGSGKRPFEDEASLNNAKRQCFESDDSDSESVENFFQPEEDNSPIGGDEFSLNDFFEDNAETGSPISPELASLCEKALTAKPKNEKINELLAKYKRPENVPFMQVPAVNESLWRQLHTHVKTHDYSIQKSQKNLSMALVPILRMMDILKKDKNTELTALVGDAFKIIAHGLTSTTNLRRETIKKEIQPLYKPACRQDASATLLFGDKMEDEMKKLKDNKLQMTARKPFLGKRMSQQAHLTHQRPGTSSAYNGWRRQRPNMMGPHGPHKKNMQRKHQPFQKNGK